jgi:hypothetical protein
VEAPIGVELLRRARQLDGILAARGDEYAFIGGLAMNAWTIPVPTYDIDLCVSIGADDVGDLVRALNSEGFVPPPTSWIESVGSAKFQEFTVHFPYGTGLRPVDVYLATDAFQREALARRRTVELDEGFRTFVATPEDLLVYKLIAWRLKDRGAIERLLAIQREVNWAYVRRWAAAFGVVGRLEEVLSEAGLG